MKKGMVFFTIVVLAVTLSMPAWGAEEPKPGTIEQKQQMPSPPSGAVPLLPDFKVERVYIAKADQPNVPFAGPFYTNERYALVCVISYTGPKSTEYPCAGIGGQAFFSFKVDGSVMDHNFTGCLAPNETRKGYVPSGAGRAFTAGNHTYECLITQTSLTDNNRGNNTKSMTYQVLKP